MSNKRDRRRKSVIYPGQSGTGRSQNTFFTETGKEPFFGLFAAFSPFQDSICHIFYHREKPLRKKQPPPLFY